MKKILIGILLVILIISGIASYSVYSFYKNSKTINSGKSFFIVKQGTDLGAVITQLKQKGIIKSEKGVRLYNKYWGPKEAVKAGNYLIKPGTPYRELLTKLQSGVSDFAIVTIPEGFSLHQINSRLEKNSLLKDGNLMSLKLSDIAGANSFSPGAGVFYELEGFLFPDTYYIPYDYSAKDIAKLMHNIFNVKITEEYRQRAKELGLSINDVITIASLIEKEAANDEERSKIAGVIYNRIKKDMLLQIDAAVIYAHTKGEKNIEKVLYSHLKLDSKYNTYVTKGLPPGPIACPGGPSIKAALYPESHDYLYYVAGDKGHIFSKTYEEHVINVRKYIK